MVQPKPERQQRTREALLIAAERAFEERPISEVTLAEIARNAGFTKGAVYSNFDSKIDLLLGVMERNLAVLPQRYDWLIESALSGELQAELAAATEIVTAAGFSNLGHVRVMAALRSAALDDPMVAERLVALQSVAMAEVQRTMEERARLQGRTMLVDAEELTVGIFALASSLLIRGGYTPYPETGAVLSTMLDVIVRGVLAKEQDDREATEAYLAQMAEAEANNGSAESTQLADSQPEGCSSAQPGARPATG